MSTTVKMAITPNAGYSADQAENDITLGALLESVQEAIERFGEEAKVVTADSGNMYGASWGHISQWEDMFLPVGAEAGDRVCSECYSEVIEGSFTQTVDLDAEEDWDHACSLCGNDYCLTYEVQDI